MRKYLYVAAAAASALAIAAPMASADAATAHHVLTIKKVGGTAVKKGAVLKASLVKGTSAVFTAGTMKVTCKAASFSAKVTSNPIKPGTAKESLTTQSVSKCTVNQAGVTIKSMKVSNLPYNVTASDKKGNPVTISGTKKTRPLKTTVTATAMGVPPVICIYTAASIHGSASNKGNTVTFTKQKFSLQTAGSNGIFCAKTATFSAKFGPVTDSSVTGHPKVFTN